MSSWEANILKKIEKRKQQDAQRTLLINSDTLVDFTSNDYLGLGRSEELFRRIHRKYESLQPHRNGSGGSRLLSGNSSYTEEVESMLARLFKSEASLIFNSGYTANVGVFSSIPQKGDTIIYDEFAHACIKDGARLSLADRFSFRHNDLIDLERKIKQSTGTVFIAIESIYSMNGDESPLKEIVQLAKKYSAVIILDEAHSTGVVGKNGSGLSVWLGLEMDIGIRIYTFGKAMGVHGACVTCSGTIKNFLVNFCRPFIYTTALPPHSIAAIDCAFEYLKENERLADELKSKVQLFKSLVKKDTVSNSPIQPIIVPGSANVKGVTNKMREEGFDIRAVLSPTVKIGSERIRICLHAFNTDNEILRLASLINETI